MVVATNAVLLAAHAPFLLTVQLATLLLNSHI